MIPATAQNSIASQSIRTSWFRPSPCSQKWVQLFEDHHLSIEQLPELKLNQSGRVSNSHVAALRYYDFFMLPENMPHPVMRLLDPTRHAGVILHLQGRDIEPIKREFRDPIPVHNRQAVFAIFEEGRNKIGYAWGNLCYEMEFFARKGQNVWGGPHPDARRFDDQELLSFVQEILENKHPLLQLAPERPA